VIISKDVRSSLSQDVGRVKSAVIRGTVCNDHAFQPLRVRYARRYLRVYLLQLFPLTPFWVKSGTSIAQSKRTQYIADQVEMETGISYKQPRYEVSYVCSVCLRETRDQQGLMASSARCSHILTGQSRLVNINCRTKTL
jgi:hypothetical protein